MLGRKVAECKRVTCIIYSKWGESWVHKIHFWKLISPFADVGGSFEGVWWIWLMMDGNINLGILPKQHQLESRQLWLRQWPSGPFKLPPWQMLVCLFRYVLHPSSKVPQILSWLTLQVVKVAIPRISRKMGKNWAASFSGSATAQSTGEFWTMNYWCWHTMSDKWGTTLHTSSNKQWTWRHSGL